MAGFHYRFSVNVGAWMGNKVAKKIVDTQLRRRDRRAARPHPSGRAHPAARVTFYTVFAIEEFTTCGRS